MAPRMRVHIYPDGRMFVSYDGSFSTPDMEALRAQVERIAEGWRDGKKVLVVGPDVEVVVMQPDFEARLARIEAELGITQ